MIKKITKYIEYLKATHNLSISIHSPKYGLFGKFMAELASYNVHGNPYCLYIKGTKECWDTCRRNQYKVLEKCCDGMFFGTCPAGVGEYVIPINRDGECVGFICVGAYKGDGAKRDGFAEKYGFSPIVLKEKYDKCLLGEMPSKELVSTLVEPLGLMLELLLSTESKQTVYDGDNYVYGHIVSYLHSNMKRKITLAELSDYCHYSQSYVSKLFKKKSGCTVNEYLMKIRIERAEKLLLSTDMSLSDVGEECGFSDTNYFIYCFSRMKNISPAKYRKGVAEK